MASFVPRLEAGDQVAYMTCKIQTAPRGSATRYLVAILEVVARFETHEGAAEWYRSKGLPVPSNCMVPGNEPQAYDRTAGIRAQDRDTYHASEGEETILREWNAAYAGRAECCGIFLACRPLFLDLSGPPELTEVSLRRIFDRIPVTQTPPRITAEQMAQLRAWALAANQASTAGVRRR